MLLSELDPDQWAIIKLIPKHLKPRLTSMGLRTGKEIKVIRRNFFGRGMIIRAGMTEIAISRQLAEQIEIDIGPN